MKLSTHSDFPTRININDVNLSHTVLLAHSNNSHKKLLNRKDSTNKYEIIKIYKFEIKLQSLFYVYSPRNEVNKHVSYTVK